MDAEEATATLNATASIDPNLITRFAPNSSFNIEASLGLLY